MKYALMFLAVLLLVGEACTGTNNAQSQNTEEIPSFDEAKCRATAKKWVKEAEGLVDNAVQSVEGHPRAAKDVGRRAKVLTNLAVLQASTGDRKGAKKTFKRAIKLASENLSKFENRNALVSIAAAQAEAGFYDLARDTAAKVEALKGNCSFQPYYSILRTQIERKDFAGAKRTANMAGLTWYYSLEIAQGEAAAGLYEDAKKTVGLVDESHWHLKIPTLNLKGKCEVLLGDKEAGKKFFERAKDCLKKEKIKDSRGWRYASIARAEAEVGMLDEAIKTLEARMDGREYCIIMTLAEFKHKAGEKKQAAKLLEMLKKDAYKLLPVERGIRTLCYVAAAQSKFVGKDEAWKTLQEAWKLYHEINSVKHPRKSLVSEALLIIEIEFEAGFRKQAEMRAKTEFKDDNNKHQPKTSPQRELGGYANATARLEIPESCTRDQALGEVAILYAKAGDFEQAHRIMMSVNWKSRSFLGQRRPYAYFFRSVAYLEIEAGVTKYIPDLIAELEKIPSESNSKFPTIARLLAQSGFEARLDKTYESMQDQFVVWRYYFCLSAARGMLKRVEDKKSAESE